MLLPKSPLVRFLVILVTFQFSSLILLVGFQVLVLLLPLRLFLLLSLRFLHYLRYFRFPYRLRLVLVKRMLDFLVLVFVVFVSNSVPNLLVDLRLLFLIAVLIFSYCLFLVLTLLRLLRYFRLFLPSFFCFLKDCLGYFPV